MHPPSHPTLPPRRGVRYTAQMRPRDGRRCVVTLAACVWVFAVPGCALLSPPASAPPDGPAPGVTFRTGNYEGVWEKVISTLHRRGFRVDPEFENKLDGTIRTRWVVGSSTQEFWRRDSVGAANRVEDTLQSTRRQVLVTVRPQAGAAGGGGPLPGGAAGPIRVTVRVLKEREDVPQVNPDTAGGATFQTRTPLAREVQAVTGQFGPPRWLPLGRDVALERALLADLRG